MKRQIDQISFAHSGFFTNQPMEDLADFLIERAPGSLDRVYFVSGGSEAVEAALKLARQYFLEKGEGSRTRFIEPIGGSHTSPCSAGRFSEHTQSGARRPRGSAGTRP